MKKYIIGIDEVGRGCLAGPVCVAAFAMPRLTNRLSLVANRKLGKLRDSKKLSARRREAWFEYFKNQNQVFWAVASVRPATIDKINISRAANRAALAAFRKLARTLHLTPRTYSVFLDGGLFLGDKRISKEMFFAATIVRGDEKIPAISAASIVAKVSRDRHMVRLAKKYPQYGFEIHKGYGTKRHYAALKKHGLSKAHRKSFLKKII